MSNQPLLYEVLKKLKKSEIRQLKKFVRSPFITHRTDLGLLFNCLAKYLYEHKPLPDKTTLFAIIFPGQNYHDQQLRSIMSDLHKLVEEYLKWHTMEQDTVENHLALAATYRQRNLSKHFQRTINKVKNLQENQSLRNQDFYQNFLSYQVEMMEFQTKNHRTNKLNLQDIGDTIDILYLSQKLRHACLQRSHQAVYPSEYQLGLLNTWIDILEDSDYLKIPTIALYYYCYRFLTEAYSPSYFRKFRAELSQYHSHFPKEELKNLYRAAINFCIRKLNEGDLEFTREGWALFQQGLEAGFFIENNHLSRFTFNNMVGFGLRLKEYSVVEQFIKNYQSKLEITYRESTVYFNFARLEYERKNYAKALEHLQTTEIKDLVNRLISKTLILKIYYELAEFDVLESHLDSFRIFIRRREVSDYHRTNFQNIIHFTQKLMALPPYQQAERKRLERAIQAKEILTERAWLLEKLGEV